MAVSWGMVMHIQNGAIGGWGVGRREHTVARAEMESVVRGSPWTVTLTPP